MLRTAHPRNRRHPGAGAVPVTRRLLWLVLQSLSAYGVTVVLAVPAGWWRTGAPTWAAPAPRPRPRREDVVPHWHPER